MDARIDLGSGLELVVINSLKFNREDKPLRDIVRRAYEEVQVPVLRQHGENVGDKALKPVDSIGWTVERGMLTDTDDPQPGYNHVYLLKNGKPIGMRVTDEFRAPGFGNVLMEYFSAMVPQRYTNRTYAVERGLLTNLSQGIITSRLTPQEILLAFTKQLTKPLLKFAASLSDGVGIDKAVLASAGYERFGPEGKIMLWVPPMNATKKEEYEIAIPTELYVRFGYHIAEHRTPEKAALFIAVNKYIREGATETNPARLRRAGYTFDTLPCVVKTRDAIKAVAAANGGYIPCSPIPVAKK